jgi:putative transposase
MIKKNLKQYSIRMMCRILQVSHSGYYHWRVKPLSKRDKRNQIICEKIESIFLKEKRRAGYRRVARKLKNEGILVSYNHVAKLMKVKGLRAKAARKFKATTNSNHSLPVAPNLLEQNFEAKQPNEKWVSDITYIPTDEGWVYLAAVMDLYSRMIIGWSLSERMTANIVVDALQMALGKRNKPKDVIVHSDRGSQYCSSIYQKLIKDNSLICSMSKRGDCYDNASMESWNHSFKVEAIYGERFRSRLEAINHTFEYIEVYYNRERLHSGIGYLSPENFEGKVA